MKPHLTTIWAAQFQKQIALYLNTTTWARPPPTIGERKTGMQQLQLIEEQ